jgi:catalase (peroxidase I)
MAITLTTAVRVRQRLELKTWESTDAAITQFIEDVEATISNYLGTLPVSGDDKFDLAGSIATDHAAYYTGISLPTPFNAEEARARRDHILEIKKTGDDNLAKLLHAPSAIALPKSTTG